MGALSGCGGNGCQRGSEGVEGGLVSADAVSTLSVWLCGMKSIGAFGLVELCWGFNDWNDECTLIFIVRPISNGGRI